MLLPSLRPGPELGGIRLAGAGLAGLHVVGGVELGLRRRGGLLGLGEGATVLGLDRPQTAAMVLMGPRGLLDATRQLRRRRHWSGLRRATAAGSGGERWKSNGRGLGIDFIPRGGGCQMCW
jgi:hypothetical protein